MLTMVQGGLPPVRSAALIYMTLEAAPVLTGAPPGRTTGAQPAGPLVRNSFSSITYVGKSSARKRVAVIEIREISTLYPDSTVAIVSQVYR